VVRKAKKIIYQREVTQVDTETGELIDIITTDTVTKMPVEPPFVKLYLEDIALLYNVPNTGKDVMIELLKLMNYSDNEIILPPAIRRRTADKLNLSIYSFNNQFNKLVKNNIIIKVDESVYVANPLLFGKGSWTDNNKLRDKLSLTIDYNNDGTKTLRSSLFAEDSVSKIDLK